MLKETTVTTKMFDDLLDDVLKSLVDHIYEYGQENVVSTVYLALWDHATRANHWASADVTGLPERAYLPVVFASIGTLSVGKGLDPQIVYWVKRAAMVEENNNKTVEYQGFMIVGMCLDGRTNAAFIRLDNLGQPDHRAQMFYARNEKNDNAMFDAEMLEILFAASREAAEKRDQQKDK